VDSQRGVPGSKESDDGGELHSEKSMEVVIGNESIFFQEARRYPACSGVSTDVCALKDL
jgi:hypothetical protein